MAGAASERVAAAVNVERRDLTHHLLDAWNHARNGMPFVCAARSADAMLEQLRVITRLDDERELEEAFAAEVGALGPAIGRLERGQFRAPPTTTAASWIAEQLDQAAALRSRAHGRQLLDRAGSDDQDPLADYAVSTWIYLGRIFARVQPCFWQGRNRWLGGTLGVDGPAAGEVPGLRDHRVSVADLVSALEMQAARAVLPLERTGYCATAAVPRDRMASLAGSIAGAIGRDPPPPPESLEWPELVVAAARHADEVNAHLLEADDAFAYGYRWPLFEG